MEITPLELIVLQAVADLSGESRRMVAADEVRAQVDRIVRRSDARITLPPVSGSYAGLEDPVRELLIRSVLEVRPRELPRPVQFGSSANDVTEELFVMRPTTNGWNYLTVNET